MFNDLKFVKCRSFYEIPVYLFEQVGGRSWTVERLYKIAPLHLINGSSLIWKLVDNNRQAKGVLWVVVDVLSEKLNVIVFSVDEEYRNNGYLESVRDFLRQFIKDFNEKKSGITLKEKINWVTNQPEAFIELGGRIPETIMVEF